MSMGSATILVHAFIQGWIRRGIATPHYRSLLAKIRDARSIKSRLCQSQNAPKLAFLSTKIEKLSVEGTRPPVGVGHPLSTALILDTNSADIFDVVT